MTYAALLLAFMSGVVTCLALVWLWLGLGDWKMDLYIALFVAVAAVLMVAL